MNESFAFWTIAVNFLRLTECACHQLVDGENIHVVVSDYPIDPSEYQEITLWSDHSIGIPILFNFFHGIELILKGFITKTQVVPAHHNLSKLYCDFEILFPMTNLGKTISKYVCDIDPDSPLGRFNLANDIKIDSWYQALKYPTSSKQKPFSHTNLRYGGMATSDFWRNIGLAATSIRLDAVKLAYSNEKN